jgi:hypothetical protein
VVLVFGFLRIGLGHDQSPFPSRVEVSMRDRPGGDITRSRALRKPLHQLVTRKRHASA